MNMSMKYIVVLIEYKENEEILGLCRNAEHKTYQELPIIFPKALNHISMFEAMVSNRDIISNNPDIVSAGFCERRIDGWRCDGESLSLKSAGHTHYKSRGSRDSSLLDDMNYTHGVIG